MRNFKKTIAIFFMACTGLLVTSCFGRFELVRKVYNWNDEVVENKFVKSLLFYAMNIIPVYGIAGAVDFLILNLVEFWSGTNPLAMEEGDVEERLFAKNGVEYKMVATKNKLEVTALNGENAGVQQALRFDEDNLTWYFEDEENCLALMSFEGENQEVLRVHHADGASMAFAFNADHNGDVDQMYHRLLDMGTFARK